jgi:hypothetical protein
MAEGSPEFEMNLSRLAKFEVQDDGSTGLQGGKTPEQIEEEKRADETASAAIDDKGSGSDDKGGSQDDKGGQEEIVADLSLLEDANPELVTNLEAVLDKAEDQLSEEESKLIEDNKDLVVAIVNKDVTLIDQLRENENYVQEGKFEDSVDGFQSYLSARDELRDKQTVESFLEERPELKSYYEHVVVNKNPPATYFARQNKPAILDTKIEKVTESMSDDQKKAVTSVQESVVRANLKSNGMDDSIIAGVVETAKANGTLESMATNSLDSMNKTYNSQIEAAEKTFREQEQARIDAEKAEIDKAVGIVKGGRILDNLNVPKADENNFVKFISTPINAKGETMADKKYSELSLAQRTAIDYIIYKDFKLPFGRISTVADRFKGAKKANDARRQTSRSKGDSSREGNVSAISRENIAKELGHIV